WKRCDGSTRRRVASSGPRRDRIGKRWWLANAPAARGTAVAASAKRLAPNARRRADFASTNRPDPRASLRVGQVVLHRFRQPRASHGDPHVESLAVGIRREHVGPLPFVG